MSDTTTRTLPLLPLPNGVVFPEMVLTVALESEAARRALDDADVGEELVAVPQRHGSYGRVGVVVRVEQRGRTADGSDGAVVRALRRVSVGRGEVDEAGVLRVAIDEIAPPSDDDGLARLAREYRIVAEELLDTTGNRRFAAIFDGIEDPGALADTLGWWPDLTDDQRLRLLETTDVAERLGLAVEWARLALDEAKVAADIRAGVQGDLEGQQREAILRRQLKAIRDELGESDSDEDVLARYRERIDAGELPEAVATAATKEMRRLEQMGDQSMEASWIRTWLDTVFEVPWSTRSDDVHDLVAARTTLDADHTGLDEVKERIVEHLAVRKLRHDRGVEVGTGGRGSGTILALVGPPGVGKTSLGSSIATAMGREFVRMSLGGIRDEAEIRGHRRTYVGARPGRIVRALIDAGTRNPVVLLDEVDKVGADWRGDPSSALLEVLDPAQNATFRDHYLEHDLDLSDVVFVATANTLETIPGPLLDRMEIIPIEGYTADEKVAIANDHLLPQLFQRNAVSPDEVVVGDDTVRAVVADHTREAGVRRLEQRLDRLVRRAANRIAHDPDAAPIAIQPADLRDALGPVPLREDPAVRTEGPGVATGLAVTGAGGDVLFVEAALLPDDAGPDLLLTGQLGDVMKESGRIALSYLRANRDDLGLDDRVDRGVHVHFPAGAIPKDGPSAGITMTTALVSTLTGRPVSGDVAMTGEITLHGRVLPIGGVKEKILAAQRAGLRRVILPEGNRADVEDLAEGIREAIEIHHVSTFDEVPPLAFEPPAAQQAA